MQFHKKITSVANAPRGICYAPSCMLLFWTACKAFLSGVQILENYACLQCCMRQCCLLHRPMLIAANATGCMTHAPNLCFQETSKIDTDRFRNKLQCLSLASLSSLVQCLWVRPGAYPSEAPFRYSSLGQAPGLAPKYQNRLERFASDKHSSLLRKSVSMVISPIQLVYPFYYISLQILLIKYEPLQSFDYARILEANGLAYCGASPPTTQKKVS